jgi:hypothetical protein
MAATNSNVINGLRPVKNLSGSEVNFQESYFATAATDGVAIFPGDLVKLTGGTDASGIPIVAQCAAGDIPVGVMTSIFPNGADLTQLYRKASVATYIYAVTDPNTIYEAQANGAVALADATKNCSIVVAAGNTVTGASGMQLDTVGTTNTTNTLTLRLMGFSQALNNIPNATYNKMYVKINSHAYGNIVAGV